MQDLNSETTGKKDPGKFENLEQALKYFDIKKPEDLTNVDKKYFVNMSYDTFCSLLEIEEVKYFPHEILDWLEKIGFDSLNKIIESKPYAIDYENYQRTTSKTFSLGALKVMLEEEFDCYGETSKISCGVLVRSYLKFSSKEREEFNKFKDELQKKFKDEYEEDFFSEDQLEALEKVDSLISNFELIKFKSLVEEYNIKFVPVEIISEFAKLEVNDKAKYKKIFVESVKNVFLSTDKNSHDLLIGLSKDSVYDELIFDAVSELQSDEKYFSDFVKNGKKLLNKFLSNQLENIHKGICDCLKNDIGFPDEEVSIELEKILNKCSSFYKLKNPQTEGHKILDELKKDNLVKKFLGDEDYSFVKEELGKILKTGFYDNITEGVYTRLSTFLDTYFNFDKNKKNNMIAHLQAAITPWINKRNSKESDGTEIEGVDNVAKKFVDEHKYNVKVPIN